MTAGPGVFTERGYRARVLSAAFRNHLQLTELVGSDLVVSAPVRPSPPQQPQRPPAARAHRRPLRPEIIATPERLVPDFARAYEPDGLRPPEFETFGPPRETLRQLLAAGAELSALVRGVLVPEPR